MLKISNKTNKKIIMILDDESTEPFFIEDEEKIKKEKESLEKDKKETTLEENTDQEGKEKINEI